MSGPGRNVGVTGTREQGTERIVNEIINNINFVIWLC